jgi:nitroreductase
MGAIDAWEVNASDFPGNGATPERLRFLARYAILAPSSHNSQPWLFHLHDDRIDLVADRRRALPEVDPLDRELIISCGAALAHLQVAACGLGYHSVVRRIPSETEPDLLASLRLAGQHDPSPRDVDLFRAILNRRTCRQAFAPKPVPADARRAIARAAESAGARATWIDDAKDRVQLAVLVMTADRQQYERRAFRGELAAWIRPTADSAADGMPAPALGLQFPASYLAPLVIRTFDVGSGQAARDQELVNHSPGIVVLTTPLDQPYDWLVCGEALGFTLLTAEAFGLNVSYLNQPCEVAELRTQLGLIDEVNGNPQLVLRLGYGTRVPPTPRRAIDEVIVDRTRPSKARASAGRGSARKKAAAMRS